jgi:hypothetical protein
VNVFLEKNASSISVFPNPVKGNTINLLFVNRETGIYQIRLSNNSGQVVYSGKLQVSNSYTSQPLNTNKKIASGIYQLEIKGPNNVSEFKKVIVQD